jgi:hypothetical protein
MQYYAFKATLILMPERKLHIYALKYYFLNHNRDVKTTKKKYSVLKFNASNNVDFAKCGGVSDLKLQFYSLSLWSVFFSLCFQQPILPFKLLVVLPLNKPNVLVLLIVRGVGKCLHVVLHVMKPQLDASSWHCVTRCRSKCINYMQNAK